MVVAGPFNAGKSTFVRSANENEFEAVESANYDPSSLCELEGTTTVGLDVSFASLDGFDLMLVGLPGQERFSFLWEILAQNASAITYLMPANFSLKNAELFLKKFESKVPDAKNAAKLLVITKTDIYGTSKELLKLGLPSVNCNTKDKNDVKKALRRVCSLLSARR